MILMPRMWWCFPVGLGIAMMLGVAVMFFPSLNTPLVFVVPGTLAIIGGIAIFWTDNQSCQPADDDLEDAWDMYRGP